MRARQVQLVLHLAAVLTFPVTCISPYRLDAEPVDLPATRSDSREEDHPGRNSEQRPQSGLDNTPSGGTLPGGTVPGGMLPGGTVPGGTVPGGTLPGGTLPGGTLPGGPLPGGTIPGGTVPSKKLPGEDG